MAALEREVACVIAERQGMKRDDRVAPDYATLPEIHNAFHVMILEALRSLCRSGAVEYRQSVNGVLMFGIKQRQE